MSSPSQRRAVMIAMAFVITTIALPMPALSGQESALTGRVLDSTNAVLPGVTVEAAPAGGSSTRGTTVTVADGTYSIALPPGTYDVSFRLLNFATTVRRGVVIPAGSPARVDSTLYLSSSAGVVVTAKQTFRNQV